MSVTRIGDGLWRWTVPHPEWNGATDWDEIVASVYCETEDAVVVIDPLVPADGPDAERFWSAFDRDVTRLQRPVAVLLTCRWHVRSAAVFRERYGASVHAPTRAGDSIADLVTNVVVDDAPVVSGVHALVTGSPAPNEECVYVLTEHRAAVVGDVLLGDPDGGLRVADPGWYANSDEERVWYRDALPISLGRLAGRDVEHLLPAHGAAVVGDPAQALSGALQRHRGTTKERGL